MEVAPPSIRLLQLNRLLRDVVSSRFIRLFLSLTSHVRRIPSEEEDEDLWGLPYKKS